MDVLAYYNTKNDTKVGILNVGFLDNAESIWDKCKEAVGNDGVLIYVCIDKPRIFQELKNIMLHNVSLNNWSGGISIKKEFNNLVSEIGIKEAIMFIGDLTEQRHIEFEKYLKQLNIK